MKFNIGDRVRATGVCSCECFDGEIGTVVYVGEHVKIVTVEFDSWNHGYNEENICTEASNHSWNFCGNNIRILSLISNKMDNKILEEKVALSEKNIRQAIDDYNKHVLTSEEVPSPCSKFVERLAHDNAIAKDLLRDLFRKSPRWNEELDAIVLDVEISYRPNIDRIMELGQKILYGSSGTASTTDIIDGVLQYFCFIGDEEKQKKYVDYVERLVPGACRKGRKINKVFLDICKAWGVYNEEKRSNFQKLYAKISDEMRIGSKKMKLFLSLNPAHFLTMSNPKKDLRGETMVSCHSLNDNETSYNNGCVGYARDNITFIAFTAANPNDPESLNNRKTTRQIFCYEPWSGILLQSRLYNTSGGTNGALEESKVYLEAVKKEISLLEGTVNEWKTELYNDVIKVCFRSHENFGGYTDWIHDDFNATISVRSEIDLEKYIIFEVGETGLCINCGKEASKFIMCDCCAETCYDCEKRFMREDITEVHDEDGDIVYVCDNCLEKYYSRCDECQEYFPDDTLRNFSDGTLCCDSCFEEHYISCEYCGDPIRHENVKSAFNPLGNKVILCNECFENLCEECDDCGKYFCNMPMNFVHVNEELVPRNVCDDCYDQNYVSCERCGKDWIHTDLDERGLCPECIRKEEDGHDFA